jgi:Cu-Zn family superoxide dismutase
LLYENTGGFNPIQEELMRTKQAIGTPWTDWRPRWAGTAAAALAVVAATSAAATAAPNASARPGFDYTATFSNVADAPIGTGKIGGRAYMVVTTRATTTSIDATGLDPKNTYIAHVHSQPCATNEGGPHFKFDPKGASTPPNEIWLTPIKVTPQGEGTAITTSAGSAGRESNSVVIHLKRAAGALADEATPPKVACADLIRTTS